MTVDYDVVILGGTPEGYEAAQYAAHLGARVAWVLQGPGCQASLSAILGAMGTAQSMPTLQWQWRVQRVQLMLDVLTSDSLSALMIQGVDVISETGHVASDRPLTVKTPSRHLTSRAILLATGQNPRPPAIPGLEGVPYMTPDAFLWRKTLPQSVAILGSTPTALVLCQLLCRWRVAVTLITPVKQLLMREDPDISQWITAQLQADGATLCLATTVTQVMSGAASLTLQLANETEVEVETLVVATFQPDLTDLCLEPLIQQLDTALPLAVNAHLQTAHPRIYACGSVLGGDNMAAIARQEARLAIENAVFWNRRRIDYCTVPYDILTQPAMARVGLTEFQANRRYPAENLHIYRQDLYDNPKAQWRNATIGFCKVIAHRNGQILGAHGVGPEANEWVQTLALLMAQKVPWWKIAQFPTLPHSLTEILSQATQRWERDRWQPGKWRRDWAENWFNWRRSQ